MKKVISGKTYYIEKESRKITETGLDIRDWKQGYGVYRVSRAPGHLKEIIGFVYKGPVSLKGDDALKDPNKWTVWGFNKQWDTRDEAIRYVTKHPHITARSRGAW